MPACQRVERTLLRDARLIPVKQWDTLTDAWEDLAKRLKENPPPKFPGSLPPPGWGLVGHGPAISGLRPSLCEDTDDEMELFGSNVDPNSTTKSSVGLGDTRSIAKFEGRLLHDVGKSSSERSQLKVDVVSDSLYEGSDSANGLPLGLIQSIQDEENSDVETSDSEEEYSDSASESDSDSGSESDSDEEDEEDEEDEDDDEEDEDEDEEDEDEELDGLTDITEVSASRVHDPLPNIVILDEEDDELLQDDDTVHTGTAKTPRSSTQTATKERGSRRK